MREDQIKKALEFFKKSEVQNIPLQERMKFLEDKLSQEEISEVLKRYEQYQKDKGNSDVQQQSQQQESQAERRVNDVGRVFMGAGTIASLSILSSLAMNYALDSMKDKREKHLREEIKERVFDTIKENTERVRSLEQTVDKLAVEKQNREQIEELLGEKFEQFENGKLIGNQKSQSLNLKLRSSQTSNQFASNYGQQDQAKELMDGIKMEITKELRDIKQVMKSISDQNLDLLKELKEMNSNFQSQKVNQIKPQELLNGIDQKSTSQNIISSSKENEEQKESQPKEEEKDVLLENDLSQEQQDYLKQQFQQFSDKFSQGEFKMNIMTLKYSLNQIANNPTVEKWRKLNTTNAALKAIINKNPETVQFLQNIGFTKQSDQILIFSTIKQVEDVSDLTEEQQKEKEMKQGVAGNRKCLEYVVQLMEEKVNQNK